MSKVKLPSSEQMKVDLHVYCETDAVADLFTEINHGRMLPGMEISIARGGIGRAIERFEVEPSPSILVLESADKRSKVLKEIDRLAEFCEPHSRVIVIGHINDVKLLRSLLDLGVSDYLVFPSSAEEVVDAILSVVNEAPAQEVASESVSVKKKEVKLPNQQVIAFIGSKGGCGSSTICHHVAWILSQEQKRRVNLLDFDLAFGTSTMHFDAKKIGGIYNILLNQDEMTKEKMAERGEKVMDNLYLYSAPLDLNQPYDLLPENVNPILEMSRNTAGYTLLDLPLIWTSWVQSALLEADQIVITCENDIPSSQLAAEMKEIIEASKLTRSYVHLVVNKKGVPKRTEIKPKDYQKMLGCEPVATVDYDIVNFSKADEAGMLMATFKKGTKIEKACELIVQKLTNSATAPSKGEKDVKTSFIEKLKSLFAKKEKSDMILGES